MDTPSHFDPTALMAQDMRLPDAQVAAVVRLLTEGNSVPFLARYRKEQTGGLDEVQIRTIQERHAYVVELHARRCAILASIEKQARLTPELRAKLMACTHKAALEDLYLPYKPKRRTRATAAKEKGLEPLAQRVLSQSPEGHPLQEASAYVNPEGGVATPQEALEGARDIVAEKVAEHAELRALARQTWLKEGMVVSCAAHKKHARVEGLPAQDPAAQSSPSSKPKKPSKYEHYYDFREAVASIPSHRFLALRRGEREGDLRVQLVVDPDPILAQARRLFQLNPASAYAKHLEQALQDSYHRLLAPSIEADVRLELKVRSDAQAVDIFASNLRNLLLAAPLGGKPVIGIDPGLRTGCKCVALSATGQFLENMTLHLPFSKPTDGAAPAPARSLRAEKDLRAWIEKYQPYCIAIGHGTGSREAEAFVREVLNTCPDAAPFMLSVNEAGASVYSASDIARAEFPDLDVTVRGAISIGRRLQDPLAELVKIDPKAIGVGQYQHDVPASLLQRKLNDVVESCVNHVGVELNTASSPLLARVSGIGPALAQNIVTFRETQGAFTSRTQLLDVPGMGAKTFEQAAGFLRIHGAAHPLDASAVHPERYPVVERMAKDLHVALQDLVGNAHAVQRICLQRYQSDTVGAWTLQDILEELQKPGRDPRSSFEPPCFQKDVWDISHVKPGMILHGWVTNVTGFGAFVNVGVHHDGLVHISKIPRRLALGVGSALKVRVVSVDMDLKQISLVPHLPSQAADAGASETRPRSRSHSHAHSHAAATPKTAAQPAPSVKSDRRRPAGKPLARPPSNAARQFRYNPFSQLQTPLETAKPARPSHRKHKRSSS